VHSMRQNSQKPSCALQPKSPRTIATVSVIPPTVAARATIAVKRSLIEVGGCHGVDALGSAVNGRARTDVKPLNMSIWRHRKIHTPISATNGSQEINRVSDLSG
jgi:hypothetical protein